MADAQIKITADTRQAERAIADLDRALGSIKDSSALAGKALAGITAVAGAVTYAILGTISAAGDLIDASDRLGIGAANLQQLQQAALLAGVGADQLNATIQRLSSNIGEGLAKGTGGAVDALNRLGLPIKDIANLKPDEQFKRISEELFKIENPAQRTAASMELFGKQGPAILKVAQELEKVRKITQEAGLIVTERDLVALDEASDAVDQLGILWDAGVKKAVAAVAPYVIAIVEAIKDAIKQAGGFDAIWARITSAIRTVVNISLLLATILVARVAAGAAMVAVQLVRAAVAARSLSIILARTPIGLIAAGAAILADKLGIDLVGAAGDFLDINLDTVGAQDQINTALDDRNTKLNTSNELAVGFNEEQKKALKALDDTIQKLQQTTQYEKDKLQYGEDEAEIRKVINEENEKLVKVGLTLNDQQQEMIRGAISEGQAIKRNNQLRQEQLGYYSDLLGAQTQLGKEIEKSTRMQLSFSGMPQKEIDAAVDGMYRQFDPAGEKALSNQKIRISQMVDNMLSAYDPLMAAKVKYEKGLTELDDIRSQVERGQIQLTIDQTNAMYNAQLLLDRQYLDDKVKAVEEANSRLEALEMSRIERTLMAERGAMAATLSERDRAIIQSAGVEERQKAIVAERIAFEKKSEGDKTKFALDNMSTVFAALGQQNKKAFEASKALAIASALVNTYQGATKALATYPFPFGLIAAAAAVAAGLAQVSAIRSQQYSGRQLGGPVMGGQSYMVGENGPELFTPSTTGGITRNNQLGGGGSTNINFTIVANDTEGFDQLLTSRRGVIQQIISDAMLERGQRM